LVRDLHNRLPQAKLTRGNGKLEQPVSKVLGFVKAPARGLDLPLYVSGTAFQQKVWQALREIRAGETASYTDIAHHIGGSGSAKEGGEVCSGRVVPRKHFGGAIPCHRW
jgi:AraC family transcriptional regulator of adaptative response/methylated-DNA-[protein]-cysteine methyltransferase